MALTLSSVRDRFALAGRALAGSLPGNGTIGGRIVSGVVTPGGSPPPRGTKDVLASYSSLPWVRAVVSRISYDTASVEWQLWKKTGPEGRAIRDGQVKRLQSLHGKHREAEFRKALDRGEIEQVHEHQLLDLLGSFNSFHTGLSGRRVLQQHMDLVGEAFWIIERDRRGMPIAIWPVPPSWVLGTPTVSRPTFRFSFRGFQGEIPATEVIWFSELDPANPYARGTGTVQALGDDVETDEYAAKHLKALFFNRARPDIIVSPKSDDGDSVTEPEIRRLENDWTSRTQGFWRAFKPYFIRRAVEVNEIDQTFPSQQIVELRKFERDTCIQVFGVSPEILGIIASGSSRATVTVAEYIYGRRTLVPRLEAQRATMQERLVPQFDERLILGYVSPVAEDTEMEAKARETTPYAFTIDEHRAAGGEEPLPDGRGNIRMVPIALQPESDEEPIEDLPLNLPGDDGGAGDAEARVGSIRIRA